MLVLIKADLTAKKRGSKWCAIVAKSINGIIMIIALVKNAYDGLQVWNN